jgi:hypothetical protein
VLCPKCQIRGLATFRIMTTLFTASSFSNIIQQHLNTAESLNNKKIKGLLTYWGPEAQICPFMVQRWWTGGTNLYFLRHVRFERTIHCTCTKQFEASSRVRYLSCLFMDIWSVTSLLSHLSLKKGPLIVLKLSVWVSSLIRS